VLSDLVVDTLDCSSHIARADVQAAMDSAAGVGRMLIAGGHLEEQPITVVAGEMHLQITTVSGDAVVGLDENLNPVPGGASAQAWTVYLPACDPLTKLVEQAADTHTNLSSDTPPATTAVEAAARGTIVDKEALRLWATQGR